MDTFERAQVRDIVEDLSNAYSDHRHYCERSERTDEGDQRVCLHREQPSCQHSSAYVSIRMYM